ncbi:hypothetical protein GCM10011366_02510 [Ornithinimicrobium tianjinense]|uniref:Lipoprotein n=1 Tax=Ornithinimicrobium tianjinense TaxID=1195761 RepID=A0A917BDA4_9MICO|nr:hypothetical protein GCM10011366_02510 [Ornithinimicrobium tianjinense]
MSCSRIVAVPIVLLTALTSACSTTSEETVSEEWGATPTTVQQINPRSSGSRAFYVESIEELAARADVIVVARMGDDVIEEPADEEGKSGLTALTTSADVAEWLKGDGAANLPVTQLPLGDMAHEISRLDPGFTYVFFMHQRRFEGSSRYILVGGVGAYRFEPDGSLVRSDESSHDTFPNRYASLEALKQDLSDAPASWVGSP